MSLVEVRRFSNALQKHVGMLVILPEVGKPPYPVFYLLHGLSDDYSNWLRRTRIEWYVRELPLIVVIPDGFRNWYTNNDSGVKYAKYIGEETTDYVDKFFPTKANRAGRGIGGLSMGGYGAMRIALGYPDRFISANSHSGALIPWKREPSIIDPREFASIFGKSPAGSDHDLLTLAKRAKKNGLVPKLRLDCGLADEPWIGINRQVHAELDKLKIDHEYAEFEGGHDWDYWDLHVQEAIEFHARNLKIKRITP